MANWDKIERTWLPALKCFFLAFLTVVSLRTYVAEIPRAMASGAEPLELIAGRPTKGDLAAGAKDQFETILAAGQLFRFSIEKGDLSLSLVLYDPVGQKLIEEVSQRFETLDFSVPVDAAGKYLLEVRSLESQGSQRQYVLKVETIRPATTEDRRISVAQQLCASASMLRAGWTEESLRQAIEKYDRAALIWLSLHEPRNSAVAAMEAAEICFLLGQYSEALKRFEKASGQAKHAGTRIEQSRGLSETGLLYSYLGNNPKGQALVLEALKLLAFDRQINEPAEIKQELAGELSNLGEVDYAKGNLLESSKRFEEALKLFDEIGDRSGAARAHLFIGYIAGGVGNAEKAATELSQALGLYRAVTNVSGEGSSLTALGLWHSLTRDEEHAIELHREAIAIFRRIGDRQSEAIALNGLGQAYENLAEYRTALDHYQQALRLFQDNHSLDFVAVTTFNVARGYRLAGDLKHALVYYEQSLKLSRAAKKTRTEANALNDVAVSYATEGNRNKTIAQYQRIIKFYSSISDHRRQALAWNNLGDSYVRFGETKHALSSYQQALPLSEHMGDKGILISTLYNIARAQREMGNFDLALSNIKESIRTIEDLRTNVASPDFQISYFSGVRKNYDFLIDILMKLDRQHPGQGFAVEGLLASESARARSLVDILTEAHADIRQGIAPELIARERELRGLIRSQAQYQMELSISEKDSAETGEVARQIDELRTEYQEIEAKIRDQSPRLHNLTQPASLSVEQIQTELRDGGSILLEYALGDERSYLWAVTADSVRSYQLPPRATLEDAAREVYKVITTRQAGGKIDGNYQAKVEAADRSYDKKALALSQMLLGPVAEQLGARRLIVVTEGALQYIPFDPLPVPHQGPVTTTGKMVDSSAAEMTPLIASHEIVTLPSVSTLAAIRQENHRPSSPGKVVAILADPVFSDSDDRVQTGTAKSNVASLSSEKGSSQSATRSTEDLVRGGPMRLLHAAEEADAIIAATPIGAAKVARDFDASRETAMSSFVGEYQIVHFATHGFFNSEHPELSGVVLSTVKNDGTKIDGFMPLQDICKLDLSAQLVVLSACETGLGKDIRGEGLMSLTRGFMFAGSRTVVTSLWKVDDRATAELMKNFYQAILQDGLTPAAALRLAKEKVRRNKTWGAPYFWAGFVLQGEYREPVLVDRNSGFRTALAILITLVLVSSGLTILQRRRRRRSGPG